MIRRARIRLVEGTPLKNRSQTNLGLLLILSLALFNCAPATTTVTSAIPSDTAQPDPTSTPFALPESLIEGPAQNIILMIGDGMGPNHRLAATYFLLGEAGELVMDSLPLHGMAQTNNAYGQLTDSAASGTALATGIKTSNGRIGTDIHGDPLPSILELAQERGMAVGLVTTTQIAHATPASFAAHVSSRDDQIEISSQLLLAGVDVLLGGGEDDFLPISTGGCHSEAGARQDGRNLVNEAQASGYTTVCSTQELQSIDPNATSKLLGLFAEDGMLRPFTPLLAQMTELAIAILSQNPTGFFLVIEGGQIDWASHGWDAENAINDTLGFDEAVQVALNYAENDTETLLIVTADHETGGMQIELLPEGLSGDRQEFEMADGKAFKIRWSTTGHTDADIPTSAYGPGSELITGVYENTHIFDVMKLALWIGVAE